MMRTGRGISMIETVVSTAIVGGVLAAAITASGHVGASRVAAAQKSMASVLARDLASEIASKAYDASTVKNAPSVVDGLVLPVRVVDADAEDGRGTDRSAFDDIDDYSGWKQAPPLDIDGYQILGATSLERWVEISYVTAGTPGTTSGSDTGVKRVTVTVRRGATVLASAVVFRSRTSDEANIR